MTKPIKKFRAGGVSAAVFENLMKVNGAQVKTYSVQIQRTFKDKDGEFKHTSGFRENDLPKVALVARKAYEHLTLKGDEEAFPDAQEAE
jgi:hypothetical protein